MTRPWMPLYVADYLADTAHLSATESGAYLHLIMHYWMHGGLPTDDRALARIAKLELRLWHRYRGVLCSFFETQNDGSWVHRRIDRELHRSAEISNKRKAAVQQKLNKSSANDDAKSELLHTHARASSQSQSQKKDSVLRTEPPPAAEPVYSDSRHELWGEGTPILISLGIAENQARKLIGTWLKSTKDDAQAVLGAIQRARDHRAYDPIPWITKALKGQSNGNRAANPRTFGHDAILAVAARKARELGGHGAMAKPAGEAAFAFGNGADRTGPRGDRRAPDRDRSDHQRFEFGADPAREGEIIPPD